MWRTALIIALCCGGCRKQAPEAPEEFSDALVRLFTSFDAEPAELAEAVRSLEREIYLSMDVTADNPVDRALEPDRLTADDVAGLERDESRDLADALPVAVGYRSPFSLEEHAPLQLMADHRPIEPYSPNDYTRTFLSGDACWESRDCLELQTVNDLTKENLLMTVVYQFYKDFRWVDLAVEGEPRWAYVGRSWVPDSFVGESGKTWIWQSFTIEVWIPRDGRGYVRQAGDLNAEGGTWTQDSTGDGTLRMLSLWGETEFKGLDVSEDQVAGTTRVGIDRNFEATDDYLAGTASE